MFCTTKKISREISEKQKIDSISLLPYSYFMKVLRILRILNGWTDLKEQVCQIAEGAVQVALADLEGDLTKMYVSHRT